jgi:hypothetical protein
MLAPRPAPSWRTTHCRLSVVTYAVYSQLTSIAGGHPPIRNPRPHHAVVTRIGLARDSEKQKALMNAVMNVRVP